MPSLKIKSRAYAGVLLSLVIFGSIFANATATTANSATWFRYKTPQGTTSMSGQVTSDHIRYGYDELDSNLRVIRHVPPYTRESYEQEKRRRELQQARKEADAKLLRAHVSPSRAKQQMQEIVQNLEQQRKQSSAQLQTINSQLVNDIAEAAQYERNKKTLPELTKARIAEERLQIAQLNAVIQDFEQQIYKTQVEYSSIIARLRVLEQTSPK